MEKSYIENLEKEGINNKVLFFHRAIVQTNILYIRNNMFFYVFF